MPLRCWIRSRSVGLERLNLDAQRDMHAESRGFPGIGPELVALTVSRAIGADNAAAFYLYDEEEAVFRQR
jgi:hypothetical protein